jgi:pimeloyl-ACP methyl ester carboxylesterase
MNINLNLKIMKKLLFAVLVFLIISSCKKSRNNPSINLNEIKIDLSTHKLATYSEIDSTKYLVVFESGGGDGHSSWCNGNFLLEVSKLSDVFLYDRAGYENSEVGPTPRNIQQLESELDRVIDHFLGNRKVILVGHSLGGFIIRDYAIKNQDKTAALLFIDPSHELYNKLTQEQEDNLYELMKNEYGEYFGGTMETRELKDDIDYASTLPNLPDVPVTVLTSMKLESNITASDKQLWYEAHEDLRKGVTDFTHISTTNSGHYVMVDEPDLVIDQIELLISKLPK